MSSVRRAARRSATEWVIRGALAVAVAALSWISIAQTIGYSLRLTDPARAHVLAPGDGRVTAQLAQRQAAPEGTPVDRVEADRLARLALRQDPTAVSAVSTLALNAQVRGDTAVARRLFVYAEHLSRRDLQTQLWGIEDAVGRGDVAGALRHYDIALRTSRDAAELLFPVLLTATSQPEVRAALARTLAAKPIWGAGFLAYAAGNSSDPRAIANLFLNLERVGFQVAEDDKATLISVLVDRAMPGSAWAYYAANKPGADRRWSRDPRFTARLAAPTIFDWRPVNDAGTSASIQQDDRGGRFDFAAPASVGGPLLQQLQIMPPGEYRLAGRSINVDESPETRPYWTLICSDGRELGRVDVPNSKEANGAFTGRFTVPPNCPTQMLSLIARPSYAVGGLSGQIEFVRLSPESRKSADA